MNCRNAPLDRCFMRKNLVQVLDELIDGVGSGALEADKEHSCEEKRGSFAL